jgi:hypothetical protein
MTAKKNQTVEDLEKQLLGIKNTKARVDILNSLASGYSQDIYNEHSPKISEAEKKCSYKNPDQKKDVETILKALRNIIGERYNLRNDVVCKIADGNTLTFILDFNYDAVPVVASAKKAVSEAKSKKEAQEKRLAKWKRDMLYNIANGDDFTKFEIA